MELVALAGLVSKSEHWGLRVETKEIGPGTGGGAIGEVANGGQGLAGVGGARLTGLGAAQGGPVTSFLFLSLLLGDRVVVAVKLIGFELKLRIQHVLVKVSKVLEDSRRQCIERVLAQCLAH